MSRSKGFIQPSNTPPKQFVRQISHYGLYSPSNQRKTLIDQIINNCKMVESPRPPLMQRPSSSALNNSAKPVMMEDKENYKRVQSINPLDKIDQKRRKSQDKRNPSCKNISISSARHQTLQDWRPVRNSGDEYYIQTLNPKQIPIQPIPISQPQLQHKSSFSKKALKLRCEIDKEKEEHLKYCRQEQRKLKLYFKQLQNRLNDIRNKEIKTLNEYHVNKLFQLDECLRETETEPTQKELDSLEKKVQEIKKRQGIQVEEDQKIEIKGCLKTGLNGMFFSFDKCTLNDQYM